MISPKSVRDVTSLFLLAAVDTITTTALMTSEAIVVVGTTVSNVLAERLGRP